MQSCRAHPPSMLIIGASDLRRQYSQNVQSVQFEDLARVVADTWQQLQPMECAPYEAVALQEAQQHAREKQDFDNMQTEYHTMYMAATAAGGYPPVPPAKKYLILFNLSVESREFVTQLTSMY